VHNLVTEMGIDTRTPIGKAMAHMAVVFAELERDFIRSRTREALALRRDHGVVLGRPRSTPDDVVARVVRERTEGKTAFAIARDLNKDAVPTPGRGLSSSPTSSAPERLLAQNSYLRRTTALTKNSKRPVPGHTAAG
jgi:hypothetical protein